MFVFLLSFSVSISRIYDENGRPILPATIPLFYDNFTDPFVMKRWIQSRNASFNGKWVNELSYPLQGRRGEKGLVITDKEKSSLISQILPAPIFTLNETIVIQYEVRAQLVYSCFKSLLRIHTKSFDPFHQTNKTHGTIEFGPVHNNKKTKAILNFYTEDKNGSLIAHKIEKDIKIPYDEIAHLYTLIIRPNNTFEYMIDGMSFLNGTFTDSFKEPVVQPKYIDDPTDKKPSDWVDDEFIPDPNAVKPDDWNESEPEFILNPRLLKKPYGWEEDEPEMIPDPKDTVPDEWNEYLYGTYKRRKIKNPKCRVGCGPYKPPMIKNKKYKGKWTPPLIKNPKFIKVWTPKQIPNPKFTYEYNYSLPGITGFTFNIWSYFHDVLVTNLFVGYNETIVKRWNLEDFAQRQRLQIKKMKISYNWIDIDKDLEIPPEPGVLNRVVWEAKRAYKVWSRIENKGPIIAMVIAVVFVFIPMCWVFYEILFGTVEHYKVE
ncbi:Calreticulin family protein [Trichomonas vaginalis G3]|uniref:Calreticulin family protein n=1 Tax=Trichomonas vaginalis (strain ATCC PRA-98 / G3) TaxID=412133 RepID=A2DLE0_TRIV3|nr:unfolded protein binding [Trichomonas vaginalis G3]EAY18758.1 Calreticulin family protein [Trichomonas vaginalis G3]KAI5539306.1 unfolded protein binding [Trichomonas vaginalis G3]|eukprot:XP_001579744.1 Calreticulin family protein [Trichomonas vaginalis G3]